MTRTITVPAQRARKSDRGRSQVFTPETIARWMTNWACANHPQSILEPGAGDGAFIGAIAKRQAEQPLWHPEITAIESDATLASKLKRRDDAVRLTVRRSDFVTARFNHRFDACVANPPYVRHHELEYADATYSRFDRMIGERLGRMTNLYGLFLLRIWQLLAIAGRAAIITPAEWLNADFGVPIKRFLLRENALDAIVTFKDAALPFPNALTTAAITLLRRGRSPSEPIRLAEVPDAMELSQLDINSARSIDPVALDPQRKWSSAFRKDTPGPFDQRASNTLGEFTDCTRGIATGANRYFVLSESERMQFGIDRRDVVPCVSKATHIDKTNFDTDALENIIASDRKIWLLRPRAPIDPAVRSYLDLGIAQGIDRRYLPSHRPEWFRPERRNPAPIWVPVFSREKFRFVRNHTNALHLTTYHGIYPKAPADDASLNNLARYLNSASGRRNVLAHTRIYGGGLRKLEPRDVLAIEIPLSVAKSLRDGERGSPKTTRLDPT